MTKPASDTATADVIENPAQDLPAAEAVPQQEAEKPLAAEAKKPSLAHTVQEPAEKLKGKKPAVKKPAAKLVKPSAKPAQVNAAAKPAKSSDKAKPAAQPKPATQAKPAKAVAPRPVPKAKVQPQAAKPAPKPEPRRQDMGAVSCMAPWMSAMPSALQDGGLMLALPMQMLDMMLAPWRHVMPALPSLADITGGAFAAWPRTRKSETAAEYRQVIELGDEVDAHDIDLQFQNGSIVLNLGTKNRESRGSSSRYQSRSLRRAFPLPVYTDASKVRASFRGGELTLVIPKSDKPVSAKPRHIPVQ